MRSPLHRKGGTCGAGEAAAAWFWFLVAACEMKFLLVFLLFVFHVEGAQRCPPCLDCILSPMWLQELNRDCCHSVVHHSAGFLQACHGSAWATRDGGGLSEGELWDTAECCMGKGQLNACSHKLLLTVSFGSCHCCAVRGFLWGTETSEMLKEEVMEVMQLAEEQAVLVQSA